MKKTVINVPRRVRYISQWEGFELPNEQHIMDKSITGCGFTEWCLTNKDNVVLCSPRNILLDNKAEQHPGEVYRINSEWYDRELGVDKDISNEKKNIRSPSPVEEPVTDEENEEATRNLCEKIREELDTYILQRDNGTKPLKILVTYDSFHALKSVLQERGLLYSFFIVVDEFQSIFTDAKFKSSTELEFMGQLQDVPRVCFLSATPMMDEYLKDIPEFDKLPYYELDWAAEDPGRVNKPQLDVRVVRSIYDPAAKIIDEMKHGEFEKFYKNDSSGNIEVIEAREVVFYVNSVNNITQIIKRCNLTPEECNILCARTKKNEKVIKTKLGKNWELGKVPLEHEPRKMFTFCTRTVYLGADFYSPCALTVVLSDANVECLAVDISLDLPQILGRQRLWSNPWKTAAKFFYKPLTDKTRNKIPSQEEFNAIIEKKMQVTQNLLEAYKTAPDKAKFDLARKYLLAINHENYKNDYVGVNKRAGGTLKPELNRLVIVSERRSYDIQGKDYADRFSVIGRLDIDFSGASGEINTFFLHFDELRTTREKLKFLCEANLSDEARSVVEDQVDNKYKSLLALGKERLKALGYNSTKINNEIDETIADDEPLNRAIYELFKEGDRITRKDIKSSLKEIYKKLEIKKSPKATDLEDWFEVRNCQIIIEGKKVDGFELIKKLK